MNPLAAPSTFLSAPSPPLPATPPPLRPLAPAGLLALAAATALGLVVSAPAQTVIGSGHVDIGVAYEDGAWDLHVHRESDDGGEEFEPGEAVFLIGAVAQLVGGVPDQPAATGFFGPAGSPLWVLPKTEHPDLPFVGLGTEELSAEDWFGDLSLTLTAVEGPGDVFLWDVGAFGDLQPRMSSRDGISSADTVSLTPGSHGHLFWGFSAPGDYVIELRASGVHATDGAVGSDPAGYRFQVVPEPATGALLVLGAVLLRASQILRTHRRAGV